MGKRHPFYENITAKKQFFVKKRLTKKIRNITIETVKTSSAVLVFSESLPLAARQVNGDGRRNHFTVRENGIEKRSR